MKKRVFGIEISIDFRFPLSEEETLSQYQAVQQQAILAADDECVDVEAYRALLEQKHELRESLMEDFGYEVSELAPWLLAIEEEGRNDE